MNLWFVLLEQPLLNGLVFFHQLTGSLGGAILTLSFLLRLALIPFTLPGMRAATKMKQLAPKIERLKKRYKNDPSGLTKAQMELYRQEGVNPAAGCLPQIVQILILIALFRVLQRVLQSEGGLPPGVYPFLTLPSSFRFNLRFFYLDLSQPDVVRFPGWPPLPGVFLLLSAGAQFLSSYLMMPRAKKEKERAKKTPSLGDDLSAAFRIQSLYLFPLMTILIGFSFPSGLVLYWFVFSLLSLGQQLLIEKEKKND